MASTVGPGKLRPCACAGSADSSSTAASVAADRLRVRQIQIGFMVIDPLLSSHEGWRNCGTVAITTSGQPSGADEVRILPARLAVAQLLAIELAHRAAGRFQYRLRCAGVPLHGAAETRVQIGDPLRQPAELHARAEVDQLRHALVAQEVVEPCAVPVIAA